MAIFVAISKGINNNHSLKIESGETENEHFMFTLNILVGGIVLVYLNFSIDEPVWQREQLPWDTDLLCDYYAVVFIPVSQMYRHIVKS